MNISHLYFLILLDKLHWTVFIFLVIMYNDTMDVHAQVSLRIHVFILLGIHLGIALLGHRVTLV